MSQPTCQVCLIPYDTEDHRPLLLPACGHTFCASCLGCLHRQGKTSCPKCRKDGAVKPISSLPVNYSLLDIAEACETDSIAEPSSASPSRAAGASRQEVPTPHSGLSDFIHYVPYAGTEPLYDGSSQFSAQEFNFQELLNSSSPPRRTSTPPGQAPRVHTSGHINQVKFNTHEAATLESCSRAAGPSRRQSHKNRMKRHHLQRDLPGFINHQPSTSIPVSPHQPPTAVENSLAAVFSRLSYNTDSPPARTQNAHSSANSAHTALEKEEQDELDFQMAVHLTFCKDSSHDLDLHSSCSSWCWQNP